MSKTLRLILGDQLNYRHHWFANSDEDVTYIMMEMRQETDYVVHHVQKIAAFFAAMRNFASWLRAQGHEVFYLTLDDNNNEQTLEGNLMKVLVRGKFERLEYQLPDEHRLDIQLEHICSDLKIASAACDTEHFITNRSDLVSFFGKKHYLMETFYRRIRRKHGWLMAGNDPEGGRWNYDRENRNALPKDQEVVHPRTFTNNVTEIVHMLKKQQVKTIGSIDPERFIWPVDREQSLTLLNFFLTSCLADFGKYQDAMHTDHWSVFHARISFSLNSKMLSPVEVIERAIDHYRKERGISLAAVEGFVRQIAGWREFMRGVYWARMPDYEHENYFNHKRPLPEFYWTGETGMQCMHHAIRQSLEKAYAHHIQRLMVTGNFALLANIDPAQVDNWYLGIYIDAIQWVELPNTRGMSQYADGGVVATKPYIASANYINKMSDYCSQCQYDHKRRTGNNACPFNALYWNFLIRHESKLSGNRRMGMMYNLLRKLDQQEKEAIMQQANHYLRNIVSL